MKKYLFPNMDFVEFKEADMYRMCEYSISILHNMYVKFSAFCKLFEGSKA